MSIATALDEPAAGWRALGEGVPQGVVRCVLADIDGVITGGEGRTAELPVLHALTAWNARARVDPLVPAITLCTGRQAPYVELMAQMTGVFLPCIFEHGAGLFFPRDFLYAFHPSLGPDFAARLGRVRAALEGPLLRTGRAFVQPGKEATMTLYPAGDATLDDLLALAGEALAPFHGAYTLARNVFGVEVRPRGIDKGVGAAWLAERIDLPLERFAGVGDSDPDLVFLERVGFAAAPANATPAVRAAVHYVAAATFGKGLLEILEHIFQGNRARAGLTMSTTPGVSGR